MEGGGRPYRYSWIFLCYEQSVSPESVWHSSVCLLDLSKGRCLPDVNGADGEDTLNAGFRTSNRQGKVKSCTEAYCIIESRNRIKADTAVGFWFFYTNSSAFLMGDCLQMLIGGTVYEEACFWLPDPQP